MSSSSPAPHQTARARITTLTVVVAAVFAAVAAVGLTWLAHQGLMVFQAPDKFAYDWRHALLSRKETSTRPDLALVMIADETLSDYPFQQPVNRRLLAALVRALDAAGPKAIGIDFIFDRPTFAEQDRELAEAIRSARTPIVLGAIDERGGANPAGLAFQKQFFEAAGVERQKERIGHLYFDRGAQGIGRLDQTIRFVAPKSSKPGDLQASFAEVLVRTGGESVKPIGEGGHIAWLQRTAADGSLAIAEIIIPHQDFKNTSPDHVLPASWRAALKDKIVIVGGNFPDRDRHLIPPSVADGRRVPGAWIHANVAAQIIDGRSLRPLSGPVEMVIVAIVAFVAFMAGRYYRLKNYEILVYFIGASVLAAIGLWLFWARGILLPSDTIFYAGIGGITFGHYSEWIARHLPFLNSK
jgi:CHASE2 domain-containing sensor protein